jgi:hypothetical protein
MPLARVIRFCKCLRVDSCSWFVILLSVRRDCGAHFPYSQWFLDGAPVALFSSVGDQEVKNSDQLCKPRNYGEPMSQGSNWNLIVVTKNLCTLPKVVNARELKFCEGCGVLLVRLRGSKAQFCLDCERPMAIAMGGIQ